jgi:hypothetical protein
VCLFQNNILVLVWSECKSVIRNLSRVDQCNWSWVLHERKTCALLLNSEVTLMAFRWLRHTTTTTTTTTTTRAVIAQSVWRWGTDWTIGVLRFDSRRGLGIFLFTTASRMDLGPTQPPIQGVPGTLSLGIKRPGREADHSTPSSVEVKEWVEL